MYINYISSNNNLIKVMPEKLYLMSVGAQLDLIDKYCFDCGSIIVGQVNFSGGEFACCRNEKCEHEEKNLDMGEAEMSTGDIEHIVIRKLKAGTS